MKIYQGASGYTASHWLFFGLLLFLANISHARAEALSPEQNSASQFQHLEQQQKARREALMPEVPEIRLSEARSSSDALVFVDEKPCFMIHSVTFNGRDSVPHWVPLSRLANQATGHCLGIQGINLLMSTLQNRLISHGWVTTRVLAPPQDLSQGELRLQIVPGIVRQVSLTPNSSIYARLYNTLPTQTGKLLDIRDIEQGLENLQRLPTVTASMVLKPGDVPGESDIVIERTQSRFWRLAAWLDDSGNKNTGRYQSGIMLALDNPASLSDLFYLTASRDLGFGGKSKSTHEISAHYSVPFGYWLTGITASDNSYNQTVQGKLQDISYAGRSRMLSLQLSRILHRNASSKTTASYKIRLREMQNFIAETQLFDQKRRTSAWLAGLSHRHYLGPATIDAGVHYQHGTRWFGALPAYEEASKNYGGATSQSKILTWNASLLLPFSLAGQKLSWNTSWRQQRSSTPLTSPDEFSIGNRWTVRGFDGERTLRATHGWLLQNTLAWRVPLPGQELYLGADYGEVSGNSSSQSNLTGHHLAGMVLGIRGAISTSGLSYDLSTGMPLSKPEGFQTNPVSTTFSLNWNW